MSKKWEVVKTDEMIAVRDTNTTEWICAVSQDVITERDMEYAALIAAAPDLLREAKRYFPILKDLQECHPTLSAILTQGTGIATINGLQHAINKAETI